MLKADKNPKLVLVDENDKIIGTMDKLVAHQLAKLHRAYSIFVFRKNGASIELLLQQRSKEKYHSGGLWTNTCCSHPTPEELSLIVHAQNRLHEEMGFTLELQEVGVFHYFAELDNALFENEMDHVLIGRWSGEAIKINPVEAINYRWIDLPELKELLQQKPEDFTAWFSKALEVAISTPVFAKKMI